MAPRSTNPYKRPGSPSWQILYRDASGRERRESTQTTNLRVAQKILADRRLEAERARAGIIDRFGESRRRPLDEIVTEYRDHLKANERAPQYVAEITKQLRDAIAAAKAATLVDLTVASVARHLDEVRATLSAKTLAGRVATLRTFGQWLVDRQIWPDNPFASLRGKGKVRDAERKFRRRGLTLAEVEKLAEAAPVRHLQSYAKSHGGRASARAAEFSRIGSERALLYWFAATTGLRASEIAAIRWEDLHLGGEDPYVLLPGKHTKNRADANLPLQGFVAAALEQLRAERSAAKSSPVQQGDHVLHVPERIAEHVRRDAMHAGLIPTHRPADRRLDFHALRYSCVRILRELGVPVEVVQKVLRHSDVRLTLQVYGLAGEDVVTATMRDLVPVPAMFSSLCSNRGSKRGRRGTTGHKRQAKVEGGNSETAAG